MRRAEIQHSHPFLVKVVLFSAILVAANEALLDLADLHEAPDEKRALIETWISRGREGLESCWDQELNLCIDCDLCVGKPLHAHTVAGFAPLIASEPERLDALLKPSSPGVSGERCAALAAAAEQEP